MKFIGLSLLTLAQSQYYPYVSPASQALRSPYSNYNGPTVVQNVYKQAPIPAGRWGTPNLCSDCFNTGLSIGADGSVTPISTDPNFSGVPRGGPAASYVNPSSFSRSPVSPNPWGGPELITPSAAVATVAVAPPVAVAPAPVYVAPPAPVAVAAPLPAIVDTTPIAPLPVAPPVAVAATTYVAPPVAVSPAAYVAAPATTVVASSAVAAPQWQTTTRPKFIGYENVRGVPVPSFADYGGVPIAAPPAGLYPKRNWWD